jgi:2'-5' RNA ligase
LTSTVSETRDHWWWRPGWKVGRGLYAWHITFANQPAVRDFAATYTPTLDALPMLDQIPTQWLHLTMQPIGFTDEVGQSDINTIVAAARDRCAELDPFPVTLGPIWVDPEALALPARPTEPLIRLRATVRQAIADVRGSDRVPEPADGWIPHVSLAYANTAGPAELIFQTLAALPKQTINFEVAAVTLIDINRDHKMYEWTDVATVSLGQ